VGTYPVFQRSNRHPPRPCERGLPNKNKIVLSPLLSQIKKPGTNLPINSGIKILVLLFLCFLLLFRQLAYPDIVKSHGAAVVLQGQWRRSANKVGTSGFSMYMLDFVVDFPARYVEPAGIIFEIEMKDSYNGTWIV
jgi:hypothetical protein